MMRLPLVAVHRSAEHASPPARAMLDFLAQSAGQECAVRPHPAREARCCCAKQPDYYLFHEHLEDGQQPLYFHEFAERVPGRTCSTSARPIRRRWDLELPGGREKALSRLSNNLMQAEQYMDFLRNRTFRAEPAGKA